MRASHPSASILIAPRTAADGDRLDTALQVLATENPLVQSMRDPATGQMLVAGTDLRHLEVIVDRLKREFHVEAALSRPSLSDDAGEGEGEA